MVNVLVNIRQHETVKKEKKRKKFPKGCSQWGMCRKNELFSVNGAELIFDDDESKVHINLKTRLKIQVEFKEAASLTTSSPASEEFVN